MQLKQLERLRDEVSERLSLDLSVVDAVAKVLVVALEQVEDGQDLAVVRHQRLPKTGEGLSVASKAAFVREGLRVGVKGARKKSQGKKAWQRRWASAGTSPIISPDTTICCSTLRVVQMTCTEQGAMKSVSAPLPIDRRAPAGREC